MYSVFYQITENMKRTGLMKPNVQGSLFYIILQCTYLIHIESHIYVFASSYLLKPALLYRFKILSKKKLSRGNDLQMIGKRV